MGKNNNGDYIVLFQGVKLSKQAANKVGLGIIFGIVGIVSVWALGLENKVISLIIIYVFALFGYFILGNRLFKK